MRNVKEEDLIKRYPYLMEEVSKGLPAFASKGNLRYLDMSVLQGLNDRWKKQHVQELQISVKRMEILEECLKLVISAQSSYEVKDEQTVAEDDSDDEQMEDDNKDENEQSADDKQVEDEDENEQVEDVDDKDIEEVEVEADE